MVYSLNYTVRFRTCPFRQKSDEQLQCGGYERDLNMRTALSFQQRRKFPRNSCDHFIDFLKTSHHFIDFLKTRIIDKIAKSKAVQFLSLWGLLCYLRYSPFVEEGKLDRCGENLNCGDSFRYGTAGLQGSFNRACLVKCSEPLSPEFEHVPQLDKLHPFWMSAQQSV